MPRTVSSSLNTELQKRQNQPIELIDLYLDDAGTDHANALHYAIRDQNVSFFDLGGAARTYNAIGARRGEVPNPIELESRSVVYEINNVNRDFQAFFFKNSDYMRDKRFVVRHIDAAALGSINDAVVIIDGLISTAKITEKVFQIEVAGIVGTLMFSTGRHLDRLCPLIFAGALCTQGVTPSLLHQETADTAASGSTAAIIKAATLAQANGYWASAGHPGIIEFTTGPLAGMRRELSDWVQATKELKLKFSFPQAPNVGDSFKVKRDCNKTVDECKTRYTEVDAINGNTANFHGFPTVVQTVNP